MKITIIGAAGCLGSSAAFNIAVHSLADEIVMIGGSRQNILKQHAMDLGTAVVAQDILVRVGNYEDIPGSDIIIVSAGFPQGVITSRSELLAPNLDIIQDIGRKLAQHCPEAVIITATNPVDPLNYAMYLLSNSRDRKKFIGYSVNDSFRFRMMAAEALKVKTSIVDGIVIGEHGNSQVLLFSSLRVNGEPVVVREEIKQIIKSRVPDILKSYEELKSGRTAGWTSAVGLGAICRAIGQNTAELIPCSAVLDGEYGYNHLSMTVPTIISRDGIQSIQERQLAPDEMEELKNTVNVLTPYMRFVEEKLGMRVE